MKKKREENIKNLEKELKELEEISKLKLTDKFQYEEFLVSKGFSNSEEMQKRINKISIKLNLSEKKEEEKFDNEKIDEEKRWPLLYLPEDDLTDEQIKLKKIQKMQRNAYFSRLEKRESQKREKEKIEELKQKDPEKYLLNLYLKKKEILEKLKNFKQIRKDLSNRLLKTNMRKMIVLAELSGNGEGNNSNEKSYKKKDKENQVDDFGLNDEDWEIYRGIGKHNISEDEEEDQNQLNEIEAQIMEMDPNYYKYNENYININNNSLLNKYLFLGVDQFRGNELIFRPEIIGVDQAGVIEIILNVLKLMNFKEQKEVCKNIFLCV
jgi:actin-related protein 5